MNILKNPHFIFDVHVSEVVDASLSVIAQTFMDACTKSEHKLSRVSGNGKEVEGLKSKWQDGGYEMRRQWITWEIKLNEKRDVNTQSLFSWPSFCL